ncbi:hypothetical protein F4808DRAFT_212941 [Astrocystis sublimbata]|nr:hypothetical protein F4808DRAFT_212941 [Astrocystis sublimbata]
MPAATGPKMTTASDDGSAKSSNTNTNPAVARAKTRAQNMFAYTQRQVDRLLSPAARQDAIDNITAFASERPLLSLFLLAQLLTALFPLLLFVTFVLSTATLAFFCAIAFFLFWTGVGLLVLVPTLFLTFGLAVLAWVWAVGSYVVFHAVWTRLPARARGQGGYPGARPDPNSKRVIFSNAFDDFDRAVKHEVHETGE